MAIGAMHARPRGPRAPTLHRLVIAVLATAALATFAGAARADNPALERPSVVSPYRFNPPPQPVSPLEDQKAQQYKYQLQKQIFDFDRSSKPITPLQDEQLRGARGELNRMDQILLPPK